MVARLTLDPADADLALDEALGLLGAEGDAERRELTAELDRFVEQYREDETLRQLNPCRKEARERLDRDAATAELLRRRSETMPPALVDLCWPDERRRDFLEALERGAEALRRARDKIRLGGGRDRLLPPSRFRLGLALADLLAERRGPAVVTSTVPGALHDLMACVLTRAGEPEPTTGLRKVVRSVVKAWKNRPRVTTDSGGEPLVRAA